MFSGIGDQHTWKLGTSRILDTCGADGYDIVYEDIMPNGGTENVGPAVSDRSSTWPGSQYIFNGEDNYPDVTVYENMFTHYKGRRDGNAADDQTLINYDATVDRTDYVVKTVKSEAVRHIESHTAGGDPFFMYIGAPAMRTSGQHTDELRQKVFDLMETEIDNCDFIDEDLQPYPANSGMAALKTLTLANGQAWAPVRDAVRAKFCVGNSGVLMGDFQTNFRFLSMAFATTVDTLLNATVEALYKQNLWDNTMIVLTSDNGAQPYSSSFNWPLKAGKNT
jgi:hypothetical protein